MRKQTETTDHLAWSDDTLGDPHGDPAKSRRVEAMFNAIAPTYERVNAAASLGQDARWRRRAVAAADPRPGDVVVDLCCGTGDMPRLFARVEPHLTRIIGVDFARAMLAVGRYTAGPVTIELLQADATRLPLADACADVVTCAFGVRNFQNLDAGLAEMRRILRPGGRAVILEFATPANRLVRWAYGVYCDVVVPRLGTWLSRDRTGAYRYLPRSIKTFDTRQAMTRRLIDIGFHPVTSIPLNLGGVVIYRAVNP
ncbi:MAG: ubiquinone/menaquinone biosynthesis methyltransferase [Phycisphaerae bacterium]|nr:ubiquinone/menaquinone biosynthesis methyltransferase [Phycisphaerae bacterium]